MRCCNQAHELFKLLELYYTHLTAFCQDSLGKPVLERQNHSGF